MKKNILNEDGSINFKQFNLLTESDQVMCIEKWSPQQKMQYLMQNTISEEECFGTVLNKIENDMNSNVGNI